MTFPSSPVRRPSWRRFGLLAALLLLPLAGPSEAAPRPVPLAGATTITWSGAAGLRLSVAKTVDFPAEQIRLYPSRDAKYVAVVFVPNPAPAGACLPGERVCAMTQLVWFRDLAETGGNLTRPPPYDAPTDHFTIAGRPHRVAKGGWDAYLFTDGTARMEIRATGLPGRASYRATGRVAGAMTRMPAYCPVTPCSPQQGIADKYGFGGKGVDAGALGWVQSLVYIRQPSAYTGNVGHGQPMLNRACVYPHPYDPDASPDIADHPHGCDYAPADPTTPHWWLQGTYDEFAFGAIAAGRVTFVADSNAVGRAAVGFHVGATDPYPAAIGGTQSRWGGYALAFAYGIR